MSTIKEAYLKEIETRGYNIDPIQLRVAEEYDRLKAKIENDAPVVDQRKLSFFQKLTKKVPDQAKQYADPRGIYIYGRVGRGKTFLMDLFYHNINVPKIRNHYYHFMQDVHNELRSFQGESDPLKLVAKRYAEKCKVLCIDEFHVIDITDAMILYRLLESLLDEGIFFITTSNREPDELYKNGLQRDKFLPAIEIIKKRLVSVPLDSDKDYRMRHLESADVWFTGSVDAQIAHFEQAFDELAGHSQGPITLDVNGHAFEMLKVGNDATWFTFKEACAKPRASQDFIQLAADYNTVFLSGVPILNRDRQNEARRFVIMIDEFYDQGVKIIIGAETNLAELYETKGTNALDFEFDRTVSRLIEMQSETYLHQPKRQA
ncbi:cell division protein ZapE [Wohlfahrtiimonas chitiniclastica]|uniref:cell division protein ZapE n=1 Tax=Wohlfahrtiimonas chitiniclastica TaxID=400946 RepID=UPI000B993DC6|nr:cell division protein ZapE [Wohlfahrtiimonas chitiniclastica]MBS7825986.1 AFG1 family ATPase [Wohlfahrtiimonas chitiniclastica]OYQ71291.1 cell division protein ZapE [Wohlfahrtiimonas chitiniclastica]OYQ82860.1 cell division protein ZapE [Wohlfahrtiimonas chitiniclastica]OYQ85168.1 cell division protein ZapE [Wohlfahrtiimonas chitiniclastica]OYQ86599.1 cell division protein ZapE [Wohlfahrtiimonas chitiniclastica]